MNEKVTTDNLPAEKKRDGTPWKLSELDIRPDCIYCVFSLTGFAESSIMQ